MKKIWNHEIFINGSRTNLRGVAILLNNNFEYFRLNVEKDLECYMNMLDIQFIDFSQRLINICAPNNDTSSFLENIRTKISNNECDYITICVDYNIILDPSTDSLNYNNINNPKARKLLLDTIHDFNLVGVFRSLNPMKKCFTLVKEMSY